MAKKLIDSIQHNLQVYLGLSIITLIGLALRIHALFTKNIYGDEMLTIKYTLMNPGQILASDPVQIWFRHSFPMLYLSVWSSLHVFGVHIWSLRLFPLLIGIISIPLIYFCVTNFFENKYAGLIASLLLALTPISIYYAADGRYYSYLFFFSLLSTYFLYSAITTLNRNYWIAWFISIIFNCLSHPFALLVFTTDIVLILGWLGYRAKTQANSSKSFMTFISLTIITFIFAIIGWVLYQKFIPLTRMEEGFLSSPLHVNLSFLVNLFHQLGPVGNYYHFHLLEFFFLFPLFIYGLIMGYKKNVFVTLFSITLVLLTFIFLYLFGNIGHFFEPKYVIYLQGIYYVFIALGLVTLIEKFYTINSMKGLWTGCFLILVLVGLFYVPLRTHFQTIEGYYDYKQSIEFIESTIESNDLICSDLGSDPYAFKIYMKDKELADQVWGYIPTPKQFPEVLSKYKNIWILTHQEFTNNPTWRWYSIQEPDGPFVPNPVMERTPEDVAYLNKLFINVNAFQGISVFCLRSEVQEKWIAANRVGAHSLTLYGTGFFNVSKDINKKIFIQEPYAPMKPGTVLSQQLGFEIPGEMQMIVRYKPLIPVSNSLVFRLDNNILSKLDLQPVGQWVEATVMFQAKDTSHSLQVFSFNSSNDLNPIVLLDSMVFSKTPVVDDTPGDLVSINAEYGNYGTLLGYILNKKKLHTGESVIISYYWKIKEGFPPETNAFTHMDNISSSKQERLSASHDIANKYYPIKEWKKGTIIKDDIKVTIPNNQVPGKYHIITGLWDMRKNLNITNNIPNNHGYISVETIRITK